jgi:LPXTG-motif cell wall-anchored protein
MAQLRKLPEAHTDFIVSLHWDGSIWPLVLVAIGAVAAVIAVLLYRRRRRNDR